MFNAYADAIELLKAYETEAAMELLIRAMQNAEEAYMDYEEESEK